MGRDKTVHGKMMRAQRFDVGEMREERRKLCSVNSPSVNFGTKKRVLGTKKASTSFDLKRLSKCLPSLRRGFDSLYPLQIFQLLGAGRLES